MSRCAARAGDFIDAPRGPGVHGRIHVREGELVGGQLRRSDACTTRAEAARAAPWRRRDRCARARRCGRRGPTPRTRDIPTLSGMESTSRLKTCGQSQLRPCTGARGGGGGCVGIALEPARDFVVIKLLRPEQPGLRLAHDAEFLALRRIRKMQLDKSGPPPLAAG